MAEIAEHKIKKSGDELNVALVKNPDIVATIAQQKKRPFMVGFAAETRNVEQYAAGKLVAKKLDMIACNDVSRADIGFASDENAMTVFFAESYRMEKRDLEKPRNRKLLSNWSRRFMMPCIEIHLRMMIFNFDRPSANG